MRKPAVTASEALPSPRKTNMTLRNMQEDLDEVRDLVEIVSMAASDVPSQQGAPMRTLLSLITAKLDGARDALDSYRGRKAMTDASPKASLALARGFIAACRAHGHRPYVTGAGAFFIEMRKGAALIADEPHHLGPHNSYPLGFDDRPYVALRDDPDYVLALIKATRETAS